MEKKRSGNKTRILIILLLLCACAAACIFISGKYGVSAGPKPEIRAPEAASGEESGEAEETDSANTMPMQSSSAPMRLRFVMIRSLLPFLISVISDHC